MKIKFIDNTAKVVSLEDYLQGRGLVVAKHDNDRRSASSVYYVARPDDPEATTAGYGACEYSDICSLCDKLSTPKLRVIPPSIFKVYPWLGVAWLVAPIVIGLIILLSL